MESRDPLVVKVTTAVDDADINRIHTDLGTLDLDLRTGIDATTDEAFDDLDYGWVRLVPESIEHDVETEIVWRLVFPREQPGFVEVTDVYGEGRRLEP